MYGKFDAANVFDHDGIPTLQGDLVGDPERQPPCAFPKVKQKQDVGVKETQKPSSLMSMLCGFRVGKSWAIHLLLKEILQSDLIRSATSAKQKEELPKQGKETRMIFIPQQADPVRPQD